MSLHVAKTTAPPFDSSRHHLLNYLSEFDPAGHTSFVQALKSIKRWQTDNPNFQLRDGRTENVYEHCQGMETLWEEFSNKAPAIASLTNPFEVSNKIWLHDFPECIDGDVIYFDQQATDEYQNDKNQKELLQLATALQRHMPSYLHASCHQCYADLYCDDKTLEAVLVDFFDILHGNVTALLYIYDKRTYPVIVGHADSYQQFGLTRMFQALCRVDAALSKLDTKAETEFYHYFSDYYVRECCDCGYQQQWDEFGKSGGVMGRGGLEGERVKHVYDKICRFRE